MASESPASVKPKRPPGSETRRRSRVLGFRADAAEEAQIEAAADRAGLTVSSYIRAQSIAAPTTRATRRPPVDKAALAKLLGEVGRIGSNVNQIARQLNSGRGPCDGRGPDEMNHLCVTLGAIWEMRDAVLLALGMEASGENRPATVRRLRQAELPQPEAPGKRQTHKHQLEEAD